VDLLKFTRKKTITLKYGVNNPAPCGGRGCKAVTVAALVEVALPPELLCPTCTPTSPANCWRCVGSTGSGWYECGGATTSGGSAAESGGGGSGVVLCCCLVLWASCCIRAAWHRNGRGAPLALAWGGPGWCMGVGSRCNLPCMGWAWPVQWALVWPGRT
jgi:hypothetical protein